MLEQLRKKVTELELGMQELQRERRKIDNAIAIQQGALAFAKELVAELEAAQAPAVTVAPAEAEAEPAAPE